MTLYAIIVLYLSNYLTYIADDHNQRTYDFFVIFFTTGAGGQEGVA